MNDDEYGFHRPTIFTEIDPAITAGQAREVAEKIRAHMKETGLRHVVSVMEIGSRYHVAILIDERMDESKAPPKTVDGVYISVSRVNSLDYWLNPAAPRVPGGPAP